jgi:hypothetical protein
MLTASRRCLGCRHNLLEFCGRKSMDGLGIRKVLFALLSSLLAYGVQWRISLNDVDEVLDEGRHSSPLQAVMSERI